MSLLYWLLLLLVFFLLIHTLRQLKRRHSTPPPWFSIPLIGDSIGFIANPYTFIRSRFEKYGKYSRATLFGRDVIFISDPEDCLTILQAEGKQVHGWSPDFILKLQGQSLLSTFGPRHGLVKEQMSLLFSSRALRLYFPDMRDVVLRHLNSWFKNADSAKPAFAMEPLLRRMTYSISYSSFVDRSQTEEDQKEIVDLYRTWMAGFGAVPLDLPGTSFRKAMEAREKLMKHTKEAYLKSRTKVRVERKAAKKLEEQSPAPSPSRGGPRRSLVEMAMHLQESPAKAAYQKHSEVPLTVGDDEMVDNLLVFIVASHETVTSTLGTALKNLAEKPEIMRKVYEDVIRCSPEGEELSYDQLKSMKYLAAVVKECLRIAPPVEFGLREATEPFQLNKYQVEPGQLLLTHYPSVHKHAFADSDEFDPDRWYEESATYNTKYANDQRNAFLTFSGGGRLCAGLKFAHQEAETFLAVLFKQGLHWRLVPDQDLQKFLVVTLKYKSGVIVEWLQGPPPEVGTETDPEVKKHQ